MKVQIIYNSLSGKTQQLAEFLYSGLEADEKSIHNLKDGVPMLNGDVLLLGYWVDKGGPNKTMKAFMETLEGKNVGIFCTLGYYADSSHGVGAIQAGVDMLKEKNIILGSYVCNGAVSEAVISMFRKGVAGPHSATPESEIRWDILKNHPTEAEMELALERFRERLEIYQRFAAQELPFRSIV